MALTMIVSCLGLLGLVIYTSTARTKEIGVRKILGASVQNIVVILSGEFVRLVIIAFVLATPIAMLVMNKWLEKFAFRTSFDIWVFAAAAGVLILAAVATLSIQTIRAARENPVNSLWNE